ncbi:histidine kinase [Streptomyces sp. NPDC000594]|uniref:histidine kinase n=1 Tax=Streptomyces sp. NPDC000594 TaxID=3154261 RepID=UPI00332CDC72
MPSFDLSRYRFRLGDDDLGALILIAAGEPVPDRLASAVAGLGEAGLIWPDGRLAEALQPLINTVLGASVVVGIETAGRQGKLAHGLLVGSDDVFSHEAWPDEQESEYVRVDRNMIVWELARMVNLQRPEVPLTGLDTVDATLGALDAALAAQGYAATPADEPTAVRAALAATGGLDEPDLSRLTELIVHLRCSWRMTAAWPGQDGTRSGLTARGFAIWDCGPLGHWHRVLPAEPVMEDATGPTVPLRLTRILPKEIWQMIAELLPDASQINEPPAV